MSFFQVFLLWVFLSLPIINFAQNDKTTPTDSCNYRIEGFVRDITNQQGLPFATVQIQGTTKGTMTDEQGHFVLKNLCQKEFDLVVSYVGYKQAIHHHDSYHDNPQVYLAPDSITLKSIIVEGEAPPGNLYSGAVETLSPEVFEQNQSESLGDLAGNITGVSILKTGQNVVKPVIHGLHSNRILIINNGVRHEFQNWGEEHAPEIDPSLAEELSVVKGAATVRYGPDALGGVLIINPPALELLTPWQGEVGVIGKTNGRSAEGNLELQKGFRRLALLGQASYVYQGYLHTPDYVLTNTGKREQSLALGGRYHRGNFDLHAYYSHFNQELGILRGSVTGNLKDLVNAIERDAPPLTRPFSYTINNPRQVAQHDLAKLKGQWNGKNQSLEAQYAFQVNRRKEFDVRRGTSNERPAIDLELFTHTLDLEWKHPDLFAWQGRLGAQLLYQDNNNLPGTNTVPFVPNFNSTRLGLYLIEGKSFGTNLLEAGIRYDYQFSSIRGREPNNDIYRNDLTYQNMTATVGWVRKIKEGHVFRTNIGTAWRPPNVSELYSFGKHRASIDYGLWRYTMSENNEVITNKILTERDKAAPSEIGIKWIGTYELSSSRVQSEITTYINYIQDYIYTKPAGITQTVRGAFPYFIYEQDDAIFAGVDASIRYMHSSKASSTLNGNLLWAKDITNNDKFVGLPPAQLQYQWAQKLPAFAFVDEPSLNLSVSYTFRQFQTPRVIPIHTLLEAKANDTDLFAGDDSDFDILPAPPGFFLAHVFWSGQINDFTLGFQIKNIFNKEYRNYTDRLRYFADEVGRNFVLSVKYSF